MNREQLLQFHKEFCDRAREIMAAKNHDYAGEDGESPFSNFEAAEKLGVCTTGQGFLVRMLDKFKRMVTYIRCGKLDVENEGFSDACMDTLNYSILMAAWNAERQAKIATLKFVLPGNTDIPRRYQPTLVMGPSGPVFNAAEVQPTDEIKIGGTGNEFLDPYYRPSDGGSNHG